ncbi:MAG: hypothetical protein HY019_03495 [Aquabacterium sp.]|uniref:PEP-CTERM sorting domain-containing protein n=1 Tax=Aquabacterium sp. TaxID=1872578 RepID=UPI0025C09606|nr:PEP-CTERM sorting domain-containing protein [Aquabacterium sp.]MBI3381050.1 hypothetical protein [Aquabacterium sp.]
MKNKSLVRASVLATLVAAPLAALASPVNYTFSTNASPHGNADVVALLGGGSQVSGQFTYDAAAPYFGNSGALGFEGDASIYVGNALTPRALSPISGSVAGHAFSDVIGAVSVSNDLPAPSPFRDALMLAADPTPKAGSNTLPTDYPRQLAGFDIGDYRLVNVRLFWVSGLGGATDFLASTDLPAALPTLTGRLALDFVRISDPLNTANTPFYNNSVFFEGLTVQASPVPEPGIFAMALIGLLAIGATRAGRR